MNAVFSSAINEYQDATVKILKKSQKNKEKRKRFQKKIKTSIENKKKK